MVSSTSESDYVVIDLPVRLSMPDLLRLNLAITKAIRRETPGKLCLPNDTMMSALEEAKRIIKLRRAREKAFGADLFSDPAWDLLLDLFVAESSARRVSVSSACVGSTAPYTTALRHMANLERQGWVFRSASPDDQRVIYVCLTSDAVDIMQGLLSPP